MLSRYSIPARDKAETTTSSGNSTGKPELDPAMADNEAEIGAKNDGSTCQTSDFEVSPTLPKDVDPPINVNVVDLMTIGESTTPYYYLSGPKRGWPCLSMGRGFRDPLQIFNYVPTRITFFLGEEWCVELHRLLDWVYRLCKDRNTFDCKEIGLVLCSYPMEGLERKVGTCGNLLLFDRDELNDKSQVPHSNFDGETERFDAHDCILSVYGLCDQGVQGVGCDRHILWFEPSKAFEVELPEGVSATHAVTSNGIGRWTFAAPWVTYKIVLGRILIRYLQFLEVKATRVVFKQVIQFKYSDSASDSASDFGEKNERERAKCEIHDDFGALERRNESLGLSS